MVHILLATILVVPYGTIGTHVRMVHVYYVCIHVCVPYGTKWYSVPNGTIVVPFWYHVVLEYVLEYVHVYNIISKTTTMVQYTCVRTYQPGIPYVYGHRCT